MGSLQERLCACGDAAPEFFSFEGQTMTARLVEAYDGDSMTVVVELHGELRRLKIRLSGVDTPEMRSRSPGERAAAVRARNYAVRACGLAEESISTKASVIQALRATPVLVRLECGGFGKYGRVLCEVFPLGGTTSVNRRLLDEGHAVAYGGGRKAAWAFDA